MNPFLPFVSVVIPVYGEIPSFWKTIRALHRQSYPENCFEVIVIDNGAFSDLEMVVQELKNALLLTESRPGSYCARNTGLNNAKGDIIAFTDSDCIPHYNWIESGVKALQESSEIGLVAGSIDVFFACPEQPTATELYDSLVSFPQELTVERYHYGATANLFTTSQVIRKVGLFDGNCLSGGDCEWGRRVFVAGLKQVYCRLAVVRHPARGSLSAVFRKSRRVTIGTMHSLSPTDGKISLPDNWFYHFVRRPQYLWSEMSKYYSNLGIGMKFKVIGIYYIVKLIQLAERTRVTILAGNPQR